MTSLYYGKSNRQSRPMCTPPCDSQYQAVRQTQFPRQPFKGTVVKTYAFLAKLSIEASCDRNWNCGPALNESSYHFVAVIPCSCLVDALKNNPLIQLDRQNSPVATMEIHGG